MDVSAIIRKKKQIISSTKEYLMNFLSDKGLIWSMLDSFATSVKGQYSDSILTCAGFCEILYAMLCMFTVPL